MKAKLTNKHTLHLAQQKTPGERLTSSSTHWNPGAWVCWIVLIDEEKPVWHSEFQVNFGPFEDRFKRDAYDRSVALLKSRNFTDGLIAFEDLVWT